MNLKQTTTDPSATPIQRVLDSAAIERMGTTMLAMIDARLNELHDDLNMTGAEITAINEWMELVMHGNISVNQKLPPFEWHGMLPVRHSPNEVSDGSFLAPNSAQQRPVERRLAAGVPMAGGAALRRNR